jgi:Peptidase family M28/PDZ domain/PA domain
MRNRKLIKPITPVIFLSLLVSLSCSGQVTKDISTGELKEHVKYLSSDSLKGRLTGSPGDSLAAIYIEGQLAKAGLKPMASNGFQRFSVTDKVIEGNRNFLTVEGQQFKPSVDFMPFAFSGNASAESSVIFAGYGFNIKTDSLVWNDYGNFDVKDKWVLILKGDPEPEKSVSGFIPFNSDRDKAMVAGDLGAAGVLLVSGPITDADDTFDGLSQGDYSVELPVLRIKRDVADLILNKTNHTVADLEKQINSTKKSVIFDTKTLVRAGSEVIRTAAMTRNVAMMLPGEDPELKNEYVIIGAHFDHLGMGGASSRARDTVAVHHGADDNASGVSGMIELAERFALTPGSHKRSIIIAAFSGEESGLLGSKYFADNPLIDLSKVNAMLNLDMIGRLRDSSTLQIGGIGTADGLKDRVMSMADTNLLKLSFSEEGYGPSDHSSFYGKNIPVLFFSTGAHLDYHTPADTWDKINYEGMKEVSELVFRIAEDLANSPERLKFREAGPKVELGRAIRRRGVTLGIMPDFAGNVKNGLRADFVTPGKPAALGGMKKGDIITSINGKTINNIQDYMFRMSQLKHGETISVEVLRNGKKEVLLIQL